MKIWYVSQLYCLWSNSLHWQQEQRKHLTFFTYNLWLLSSHDSSAQPPSVRRCLNLDWIFSNFLWVFYHDSNSSSLNHDILYYIQIMHRAASPWQSVLTVNFFQNRLCGYIVTTAPDVFVCHVFQCSPNAAPLTKALAEACEVRLVLLSSQFF